MSSPIIFEKGTRDFSTLGLGLLSDAIQATTTEELNGQFIFEMDYPVSGNNADLIKENRIIVVNSGHILKRQGFIIRQIVRKIDLTMTVYAEHVSYATLDVALAPVGTISGDAKTALENWKRMLVPAVDFTVDSDILTTNSTLIGAPEFETARQGLGGHTGSILDVWGGEYQFDNWHIRLLKQRGKSANAIIAYGRNLISFEQDTNIADTYTSVYPYYQENSGDEGNKTHFLPERTVDSEFVGKYPNPKVLMLDLSNKFKDAADYSENKLRNYALSYIQSNNIGVPRVNMKISTVDLSRATGGFSEDIDLGDTVTVYFEKLGITTSAKVIKAVWNVLSDDYDKFEIGARRASLTESISELATTADENANKALNQALVALQSADGKSTIYYLNSSDPWPTNPNENDTAFVKDGENSIMYRYMFNNDTGMFSWVKILDSMSADQIKQRVSDALESGKAYSDKLVADNVAQVNTVLDDVQAKQADLTAQQAELDTKAQGYANKALADAKANTLATATQTAKEASDALAKAKTDLTTSLNKEVTDRANAVTALDTKAKGYADTAKADAISASTTADGVINKKIDDTASSITSTISQNKTDADGKITTAQSTATQALNGLATKVSQTVYDAKTGQLQTDLNTTTTTANQAKTDIVAIKSDNTKQDARMTTIESDANGTKTTVSNLQTDLGKANGSITTLQQRADGFDATVTKVNNLSVGGRNLLLDSQTQTKRGAWYSLNTDWTEEWGTYLGSNIKRTSSDWDNVRYHYKDLLDRGVINTTDDFTYSAYFRVVGEDPAGMSYANMLFFSTATTKDASTPLQLTSLKEGQWVRIVVPLKFINAEYNPANDYQYSIRIEMSARPKTPGAYYEFAAPMLERGSIATDYTSAPEDLSSATAKAQLKADEATLSINNYKTDADGRISKAQADIIVNANAITQKVSQSDYNAKTGDLTTKVNAAQSTADSATSTIGAYKTSNDERVASAESKITANATAITSKVSQSDYNTKTGQIDGQISTINQTAGKISQTVSDVKAQVDGLSVGGRNIYLNSKAVADSYGTNGNVTVTVEPFDSATNMWHIVAKQSTDSGIGIYIWDYGKGKLPDNSDWSYSADIKGTGKVVQFGIEASNKNPVIGNVGSDWSRISQTGHADTGQLKTIIMYFDTNPGPVDVYIKLPKLETGNLPTAWTPAPEDTAAQISIVSQTVDGISSIVSDPTTGLTKRVQTAEGTLSQVTGADIPNLQKSTYWQPYGSLDFNSYTKQGSFFFNTTSAKTNGPTSSTSWTYLMVEQGTADNGRIKQTAWYDGVTGVKITYVRTLNSGTWSPWYANDNDSVTTISQTNGVIKQEISDRQNGDENTLTQAKDFTTSSISNSESGMRSLITQTSDSIIAKVDTKTDSATVLSLLKDNWSIGITGNTNKLASGIAADPSAMAIVSPKVIIDSPQTQITGTAWIKTAMIGIGQVATAQIGDLAVTSAKISSLDVDKLTGNVTNFIQSNWNGVYGSTTITNNGMQISTSDVITTFGPYGIKLNEGGESVGGIGVSSYKDMPANFQGISFRLDGTGDYMTWSARESGVTTGDYSAKLSWFRSSYKPTGQNAGFNFSDDSPVTFWGDIYGREHTEPLKIASFNMQGVSAGGLGHGNGSSAITFGGDGETYIISSGTYYRLTRLVKALQPLIGLGTWSAPRNINSNGVVTQWTNITT